MSQMDGYDDGAMEEAEAVFTGYHPLPRPPFEWPKLSHESDDEGGAVVVMSDDESELVVEAYEGTDDKGMSLAVLSAAFRALQTPLQARALVQEAIQKGPINFLGLVAPRDVYGADEGVDAALTFFAMAAASAPAGLVLKMGQRTLVLAAHGSQVVFVDFRAQPTESNRGFPVLGGPTALVMVSQNPLEVSVFLKQRYETTPFAAELYELPLIVENTTTTATTATTSVDGPVARLSLEEPKQVNADGKRDREREAPAAALGSPRASATPTVEPEPKRAKTPPLAPATVAASTGTAPLSTPAKAEKRKSVPTAGARKSQTPAVVAAAVVKKESDSSK